MSHEVLLGHFSSLYISGGKGYAHDAVHDIESFFWVLIHLALTRGSPGGKRRQELERDDENGDDPLHQVIGRYFDCSQEILKAEKQKLFAPSGNEILEKDILSQFHPYFNPLKDLVRSWYNILVMAFRWRSIECIYIHDFIIDLLGKEVAKLQSNTTSPTPETVSEVERREKCRSFISNAFTHHGNPSDPQSPNHHQDRGNDVSPGIVADKSKSNTAPSREVSTSPSLLGMNGNKRRKL